jgi:hypothetical protein
LVLLDGSAPWNIAANLASASICSLPTCQNGPAGCGSSSACVSCLAVGLLGLVMMEMALVLPLEKISTFSTTHSLLVLVMYTV